MTSMLYICINLVTEKDLIFGIYQESENSARGTQRYSATLPRECRPVVPYCWVPLSGHLDQAVSHAFRRRLDFESLTLAVRTFFPTETLRHLGREANRKRVEAGRPSLME